MFWRYNAQASPQAYPNSVYYGHPMMDDFEANGYGLWFFGAMHFVTWLLVIAVLVALLRWLWKKGDSERSRK